MKEVIVIEKNRKLMPTNDYIFKKIFGSVGSETITTSFLEAILESKITSIDLDKNSLTDKNELDDKVGIMDIRLEINGNINCDVEMQMVDQGNIEIRLMRYVSELFIGQDYIEAKISRLEKIVSNTRQC